MRFSCPTLAQLAATVSLLTFLALRTLTCAADAPAIDLGEWLRDKGSWEIDRDEFMTRHRALGFRWVSAADRQTARSIDRQLGLFGLPAHEVLVRFEDGTVSGITVSLYNRGDAGSLGEEQFEQLVEDVSARVTAWAKRQGDEARRQRRGRARLYLREWGVPTARIGLLWAYTPKHRSDGVEVAYRAEYVTVRAVPPAAQATASISEDAATARDASRKDVLAKVTKTEDGDVFIDGIPMVNQGDKGYCSVATTERVLRHYGMNVDQHELAQIAETSAQRGTNPEVMLEALQRAGAKLGVRVRAHIEFDYRDLKRLMSSYNSLARRQKEPQVDLGRAIIVSDLYSRLDIKTLKEARLKHSTSYRSFQRDVHAYVGKGVPLLWTVVVGLVPETPAISGRGGHMRLIIGHNDKTSEIIYSDTWGTGHEKKRMALEDAWMITTGLFTIEPRYRRNY